MSVSQKNIAEATAEVKVQQKEFFTKRALELVIIENIAKYSNKEAFIKFMETPEFDKLVIEARDFLIHKFE